MSPNEARFLEFCRPALAWLVRPAFSLEPHSTWRWGLLNAASLLARLLLVVYRAREGVRERMGLTRGARATSGDKANL